MRQPPFFVYFLPYLIFLLLDWYVFQALKTAFPSLKNTSGRLFLIVYILFSLLPYILVTVYFMFGFSGWTGISKTILIGIAQLIILSKLFVLPFLLIDDITRFFKWIFSLFSQTANTNEAGITRSQFLNRAGLLAGGTMFGVFLYGIAIGAYNYRKRKITLAIPDLPDEWKDLKIVQISDLHLGSFSSTNPTDKIVELINAEQPDFIFFTGDLVNYAGTEVDNHVEVLKKLKAKEAIYSILGNHDYGMYNDWKSKDEQAQNFNHLLAQQKALGWELLLDENRILERNNKTLAIIGVQYIGHSLRFGQFGNLDKAYSGAEHADVQLLLSHDPSHWDKDVSVDEKYKKIHATFSGHTHGFQFGVEIPKMHIKWSPSQWVYPHWAGLYNNERGQYLYVNRGAGFLGYPGRVGIPPEITIIQFKKK